MDIEELYKCYKKSYKVSTDTRKIEKNCIFFALRGTNFNGNQFACEALEKGATLVVVDQKQYVTSPNIVWVNDVLTTLQNLASYHREKLGIPIIALTGSNGKTTTKELIKKVLSKKFKVCTTRGNLNNHIGVPLTLLSIISTDEMAVVEMGANHQKEIEALCKIAQPDYGYITNFGQAHLEGFGGIKGVIKGKTEMYDYCLKAGKMVFVNNQDPIQVEKSQDIRRYTFGQKNADVLVWQKNANDSYFVTVSFDGTDIKSQLIGSYNFSNIACAIAIGKYFKVEKPAIKQAIESYQPQNNRSQLITKKNTQIVLDAYNANPSSMRAVLTNFSKQKGKKTAILGDMFELGEYEVEAHQKITDLAIKCDFEKIMLVGKAFAKTKGAAIRFLSTQELKCFLTENPLDGNVLIKGSRDMRLETIVENL